MTLAPPLRIIPPPSKEEREEQALYEMLDMIDDPDERLLMFAYICLTHKHLEKTDELLREAMRRKQKSAASWFAVAAYSFLNDKPRRYWAIDKIIECAGSRTNYLTLSLDLILREDHSAAAHDYCELLCNRIIQQAPNDYDSHNHLAYAAKNVLGWPEGELEKRLADSRGFERDRARFKRKYTV
jgi:hypothetical protein